jgi:hypothetical protein
MWHALADSLQMPPVRLSGARVVVFQTNPSLPKGGARGTTIPPGISRHRPEGSRRESYDESTPFWCSGREQFRPPIPLKAKKPIPNELGLNQQRSTNTESKATPKEYTRHPF